MTGQTRRSTLSALGSVFGPARIAAVLPWQADRLELVCRVVDEDRRKRRLTERLEKICNPAFTGTITRMELTGLLERKGFKVVYAESWHTWVSFQRWLKPHTPGQAARQLYRRLIADRGRNSTGMCPFVERGKLFLQQSWLAITAEKR